MNSDPMRDAAPPTVLRDWGVHAKPGKVEGKYQLSRENVIRIHGMRLLYDVPMSHLVDFALDMFLSNLAEMTEDERLALVARIAERQKK